jgi:hypothetical protein
MNQDQPDFGEPTFWQLAGAVVVSVATGELLYLVARMFQ